MVYLILKKVLRLRSIQALLLVFLMLASIPLSSCLQVSGWVYTTEAAPGSHISHGIDVGIGTDERPTDLLVDILDWDQPLSGGNNAIDPNAESNSNKSYPYSARGFLKISQSSIHLEPGKPQKVILEGDIPTDVGDGCRYAIISIHGAPQKKEDDEANQTVNVGVGVNVLVAITISGSNIRNTSEIESLDIAEPVSSKQQNISLIFKNTGNHHYKVRLDSDLLDKDGNILANVSLEQDSSILPEALRRINYSFTPDKELQPGTYNVLAKISLLNGTLLDTEETEVEVKS